MKIVIIGAGLSGLLAAKKLLNNGNDDITIVEKGKSLIDRISDLERQKRYFSPYGEGGRIFFNFKPFILNKDDDNDIEFINILREYNIYNEDGVIKLNCIINLIKSLHNELSKRVRMIYNNAIVDFYDKNSKLGGVVLKNYEHLDGDEFIFSFGLLDKYLYNQLWNNNVGLKSLSTFIPLKISILLKDVKQFEDLNAFIAKKPMVAFNGRISFIDEYQKETNIVELKSSQNLVSFENFSFNNEANNHVNFNLNISITEGELSGFQNSSLKNLALLSLIERNQYEADIQKPITYKNFLEDNIFDEVLSLSISEVFKKSIENLFKDFDDDFKSRMKIHGVSTISLRPIQIISDDKSRSVTFPNVIIIGNAKKNFSNLKSKILDTLKTLH